MTMDTVVAGRVMTISRNGSEDVEWIRASDGVITDTGSGPTPGDTAHEVLDFGDRVVMPGFVDPHAHLEVSARAGGTMVDVRVPRCSSVEDVLDALRDGLRTGRHGSGWLRAQGNLFFNQKLADKRYPTLQELDSVSPSVPIAVHAGGHTTLLNSAAIELADLGRFSDRTKGSMGGAVIEMGSDGRPTGVVSEVDSLLPIRDADDLDLAAVLTEGAHDLFTRYGVTLVGDISGSVEGVRQLVDLVESGRVPQRLEVFVCAPGTVDFETALRANELIPADARRIRQHGVKVFSDGGYSSKNAATHTAYRSPHAIRPGSRGKVNLDRRQLVNMMRRTADAGLQLAVHANGERAQDVVVIAAEQVRAGMPDAPPTRVEHAGNLLTRPEALDGWRRAGIVPVPQPVFLYNFGDFFPTYLGPVAGSGRFPFRFLHDEGFALAGSSDVYVGAEDRQTNPFFGIWCCLRRQTFLGEIVEPDQAVTLDEALRMHTINAADALGLGGTCGSLEKGKTADLVVLDRDPRTCTVDELLDIQVDHVMVGGRLVHSREGAAVPARQLSQ
jgi:predicted amidohydrolase YtcJ